jgi:multiphosphoryl transfer protein
VVGIVLVSHSHRLAEGAAELARQMTGDDVPIETAGGLDEPDHPIGTDAMLVMAAIERAWSDDGVLVLMDLGSAVLSAEMALDFLDEDRRASVQLTDAPLVEGAVAAAVTAKLGAPLDRVAAEARGGLAGKRAHLGITEASEVARTGSTPGAGPEAHVEVVVDLPHGLHARPAARLVQTVSGFDADVDVTNLTSGRGPVDGRSLNAVATLGVTVGQTVRVVARGHGAGQLFEAVRTLAARRFDEASEDLVAVPPAAAEPAGPTTPAEGPWSGIAASPGVALGPARRFHVPELPATPTEPTGDPGAERAALDAAIDAARTEIARQRDDARRRLGEARAAIFDAHLLFLQDEALLGPAREAIAGRAGAAAAWHDAVAATARAWDGLDDPYLRERAADLRSVGRQVLARLLDVEVPRPRLEASGILVAPDLEPADTAGLDPRVCRGIATAHGGPTAHAAVIARALGIPAVVGLGEALDAIGEGTPLGLDGDAGLLHVTPDAVATEALQAAKAARDEREATARTHRHEPAVTVDAITVEVAANIGTPDDVAAAVEAGCDGVGLFRTEFLFMARDSAPDAEEQEAAYRRAAEALGGRPMVVRTLDAGADKPLPWLGQEPEANPFLGVRGLRLGLTRPNLLDVQLRALLRVAADHPVRIMFPMVATVGELRAARSALERVRADLMSDASPEVGVMIEVPSAALTAARLAREVDFFSIGTNDLTQYTLAADRGNEHVAALADPLHPAVLRLIAFTGEAARAHGAWVGVCGELAGDPAATPLLLAFGVRELSMGAPAIASVKEAVRATTVGHLDPLRDRALDAADGAEVRTLLGGP